MVDVALLAGALAIPGGIAMGAAHSSVETVAGSIHVVDVPPPHIDHHGTPIPPGPGPTPGPTPGAGPVLGQAQQSLVVEIRSGGPLQVTPSWVAVVLHRDGDHWVGHLGPVQLVDPRGTLAGWHVVASIMSSRDEGISIVPGQPTAIAGRQSEVTAGGTQLVHRGDGSVPMPGDDGTVLMSAAPGGGGGTFSVSPTIVVRDRGNQWATPTVFVAISAY